MAWSPMEKSCSFGLQYVFYIMSKKKELSLNKVDVHNCRLYVEMEIETRVGVQVVRMIRLTKACLINLVRNDQIYVKP